MTNSSSAISTGNWPSWVTPSLMAGRITAFSELRTAGNWIFWLENRAEEGGRGVVVGRTPDGDIQDLTPEGVDVGTRVHEYGGGAWDIRLSENAVPAVVFSDRRAGGIWYASNGQLESWIAGDLVPEERYADFCFDPCAKGAFCVRETHGEGVPRAALVHVAPGNNVRVLCEGADFYAAPRPSPDGTHLAWFCWQHPEMPWTVTTLKAASIRRPELILEEIRNLSGKEPCSIIEPRWADDRILYATSDIGGRWTPVRFQFQGGEWQETALPDAGAEIGLPHWVFGQRTMTPLPDGTLLALGICDGFNCIFRFDGSGWNRLAMGMPVNVPERLSDGRLAWIDAPSDAPPALVVGNLGGRFERFRDSVTLSPSVTAADISVPEPLSFPVDSDTSAHAFFYPPANGVHGLREGEKPPLVVMAHGGPTGRANPAFALKIQWWTSRGFAVLDVNYRGSTGFGRAYREALDGAWGVVDVDDCLAGVRAVVDRGLVDPARCVIRGSSAGGLTVLAALARSKLFAAGTSLYGVTDLRALAQETHKFEARYLHRLVGPYPEEEKLYLERSPLTHAARITAPVLFLHGGADKVVPLSQARDMQARLKGSALHVYPEEGHGFRSAESIEDAFIRELDFYRDVLS